MSKPVIIFAVCGLALAAVFAVFCLTDGFTWLPRPFRLERDWHTFQARPAQRVYFGTNLVTNK